VYYLRVIKMKVSLKYSQTSILRASILLRPLLYADFSRKLVPPTISYVVLEICHCENATSHNVIQSRRVPILFTNHGVVIWSKNTIDLNYVYFSNILIEKYNDDLAKYMSDFAQIIPPSVFCYCLNSRGPYGQKVEFSASAIMI
jgi:hypothetical protein